MRLFRLKSRKRRMKNEQSLGDLWGTFKLSNISKPKTALKKFISKLEINVISITKRGGATFVD